MAGREERHNVLVLGCERHKAFSRMLREIKLVPTFVRSLEGLLHALRHMQAAAILVDRTQRIVDELELVLNVRDLDKEIPILLVGSLPEARVDAILSSRHRTYLIRKPIDSRSLAGDIKGLATKAPSSLA